MARVLLLKILLLELSLSGLLYHSLLHCLLLFLLDDTVQSMLILVVDKVAAWTVRTEAHGVVRATQISFVLWVPGQVSEFMSTVSELTLIPIFAVARLLKRAAHFSLVPARVDV